MLTAPVMPPSKRIALGLTALIACASTIVALNSLSTTPRFEYPPLNYATVILLTFSIPAILFWLAFAALTSWWRWGIALIAAIITIPTAFFSVFAFFELQSIVATGVDASFESIAELKGERALHRVYRTNGGATTAYGIVLRKERSLLPGLKLVTVVRNYYPAHEATLERLPSGQARLSVGTGIGGKIEYFDFSP